MRRNAKILGICLLSCVLALNVTACFGAVRGNSNSSHSSQSASDTQSVSVSSEEQNEQTADLQTAETLDKKTQYISQCETVSYEDVARTPDNYKNKKIIVSGEVIQVQEGLFNSVVMRVGSNGAYDDIWYVTYTKTKDEANILENDKIVIYGECTGTETYTTVLGSSVTIPSVEMVYYELNQSSDDTDSEKTNEYTLGDTVTANGFTFEFSDSYSFNVINNSFSDLNGAYVVCVPVTITNNSGETGMYNSFDVDIFGSKGIELDTVGYYFDDETFVSIEETPDVRDGVSVSAAIYMLYDGDGDYFIVLDDGYDKSVEIKVPVVK